MTELENKLNLKGFKYLKLSEIINKKKLWFDWNIPYDVPEYDPDMVVDDLEPIMSKRGGIILEFHSCELFPE